MYASFVCHHVICLLLILSCMEHVLAVDGYMCHIMGQVAVSLGCVPNQADTWLCQPHLILPTDFLAKPETPLPHILTTFHASPPRPSMNSVASKRLFQEYKQLTLTPPEGITAGPVNEDDLFHWEALIQGPEGTPYEGGIFPAELKFPKDYPLMPPTMKFTCDIWHPNGTPSSTFHSHNLRCNTEFYPSLP